MNHALWSMTGSSIGGWDLSPLERDALINLEPRYLASPSLQYVWPEFREYLSKTFQWSQPIVSIVERAQKDLNLRSETFNPTGDPYMALHVRRGM
jgi:hypothetical protein